MKINQFATNEVIFYHSIVTGDTIALELTQVTENIPKTVNPVVQIITDNWFKCEFTTVTGSTQENLTGGTIYCRYDGYYDYKLKRNGTTIEDSQFFMQGPAPIIIENQAQNTYVVTNPYAGSSGTSGRNATAGSSGQNGSSGLSGTSGVDGAFFGSSGTSGSNGTSGSSGENGSSGSSGSAGTAGANGTSGINGTSGVNGSSGSSGQNGTSGVSGSSGSSASSGASGTAGSSGSSGTAGVNGITAGRTYYFNQSQNSDISPYKVLTPIPNGVQQTVTKTLTGNQQNVLVQEFITAELGFGVIPGGTQRFHTHNLKQASNDQIQMYVTIQLANSAGTPIGPLLQTGNSEIGWVDASTPVETTMDLTLPTTTIDPTNRMIVKIYYSNNDSTSHNVTWYTEGTAYYSFVMTSVGASASTSGTAGTSGVSGSSGSSGSRGSSGSSGANGATGAAGTSGISGSSGTSYAAGFVQTRAGSVNTTTNTNYTVSFGAPMPSTNYAVTMESYANVNQDYLRIVSKSTTGFTFQTDNVSPDTVEWMAIEYNTGTGGIAYGTSGSSGSAGSTGVDGFGNITTVETANVTKTNGNIFTKSSGGNSWNAGFYAQQGFPGAYVSAEPSSTTGLALIGISSGSVVTTDPGFIDYGMGVYSGSTNIVVIESGTVVYTHTSAPTASTRYLINYDTTNVRYYIDGVQVYVTARPMFGNLFMDAAIFTQGAGFTSVAFGPLAAPSVAIEDIYGDRLMGSMIMAPASMSLINVKKNLFGRVPVQNNRMFLNDSTSPGSQVTLSQLDTTNGTLQCSFFPFLGGIGGNKISTILPFKAASVTAETKVRIMFYECHNTTQFTQLNALYGTYVANNYFQFGYPSVNTYINNAGSTISYSAVNASTSVYIPLPKTLIGYSAVITIPAGGGNNTIGHTQMFAADGSSGFFLPDGMLMMVVEFESTNATTGTWGRLSKTATAVTFDVLNCSPNWTSAVSNSQGIYTSKLHCLQGGGFKTVAQGGMSSNLPPQTITTAELAAIFGGTNTAYGSTAAFAPLSTMITFA